MENPTSDNPSAFVIMPFGEAFDEIYNLFIAEALSEAGYAVSRADDLTTHQNIIKDIVNGVASSDLIVADLTSSNPNVYYELGLAHALGRRVILLTQQITELPFDLRSYRVIPYDTHFAQITRAKHDLVKLAKGALAGTVPFGSPVSDFLQPGIAPALPAPSDGGEPGILDHLVGAQDAFEGLAAIITDITSSTGSIGESTIQITERIQALPTGSRDYARSARTLVIGLAQKLGQYAKDLSERNTEYSALLADLRSSLEFIVRNQKPTTAEERNNLTDFLNVLKAGEGVMESAKSSLFKLVETIRSSPKLERSYSRAADEVIRELNRYADNIDQTMAIIVRSREVGEHLLSMPEKA
jgi:hypothetical protein